MARDGQSPFEPQTARASAEAIIAVKNDEFLPLYLTREELVTAVGRENHPFLRLGGRDLKGIGKMFIFRRFFVKNRRRQVPEVASLYNKYVREESRFSISLSAHRNAAKLCTDPLNDEINNISRKYDDLLHFRRFIKLMRILL